MRSVILASASPRRKDLLAQMEVQFSIVPSDFDEYLDHERPARDVAIELGLGKARAVAAHYPDALVIGSDTIVTIGGRQLGKPADVHEARAWLREHTKQHALITTSIVLICKELNLEQTAADEAEAVFKPYDQAVHEAYLATGNWADKAGGWGLRSGAAPLVAYIRGRYDTILGLPTHLLAKMLRAQGIPAKALTLKPPVPQK